TYRQSYNAKPRYALENQPKTTTEDDAIKDDDKYRYNRKGFLEDDESSDDSILIVDPGWDDYCLQALKLNRPIPLCPEARRARINVIFILVEEEKDFNSNEVKLLKELLKEKTEQVQQMIRDQAKEYYENKAAMQKKEEIWQSKESLLVRDLTDALKIIDQLRIEKERLEELRIEKTKLEEQKDEEIRELKAQLQKKKEEEEVQFSKEEFPPLGNIHVAKPCVETEIHYFGNATASPKVRKVTNQLYNVKVEFDIPNCTAFGTTAIIDTGASACCINKRVIPEEALEPLTQTV
ncbi:hypothetical protein Tco_1130456, partial [Tanacetum coccineum]